MIGFSVWRKVQLRIMMVLSFQSLKKIKLFRKILNAQAYRLFRILILQINLIMINKQKILKTIKMIKSMIKLNKKSSYLNLQILHSFNNNYQKIMINKNYLSQTKYKKKLNNNNKKSKIQRKFKLKKLKNLQINLLKRSQSAQFQKMTKTITMINLNLKQEGCLDQTVCLRFYPSFTRVVHSIQNQLAKVTQLQSLTPIIAEITQS